MAPKRNGRESAVSARIARSAVASRAGLPTDGLDLTRAQRAELEVLRRKAAPAARIMLLNIIAALADPDVKPAKVDAVNTKARERARRELLHLVATGAESLRDLPPSSLEAVVRTLEAELARRIAREASAAAATNEADCAPDAPVLE